MANLVGEVFGAAAAVAKGMGVTLKEMMSPTVTENYPDEPAKLQERFRGVHVLQRLADSAFSAAPQLISISQDDVSASREFQQRFGVSMPTLIDAPRTFPASNAYRIASVPSLFLIEPDGKISFTIEGFNKAALQKLGERFHAAPFRESDRVPDLRPG